MLDPLTPGGSADPQLGTMMLDPSVLRTLHPRPVTSRITQAGPGKTPAADVRTFFNTVLAYAQVPGPALKNSDLYNGQVLISLMGELTVAKSRSVG